MKDATQTQPTGCHEVNTGEMMPIVNLCGLIKHELLFQDMELAAFSS